MNVFKSPWRIIAPTALGGFVTGNCSDDTHRLTCTAEMRFCLSNGLCLLWVIISHCAAAQQPANGCMAETADSSNAHSHLLPDAAAFISSTTDSADRSISLAAQPFGSLAGGLSLSNGTRLASLGFVGLQLQCTDHKHWNITAGYALAGGQLPDYLALQAETQRFIPGFGYAVHDDVKNLYHTHYTYGSATFKAGKHFLFDLGKQKHFWGDGHRSLIVSDNAAPANYARITTNVWKLRYTNLWMQLRDLSSMQPLSEARTKYSAMHALSYAVSKKLNVSLYEWVIWQDRDTLSRRTLDLGYLNPLIFYRPVEYTLGSPDNVILAASIRWEPWKRLRLYGQFVLDEFNLNLFKKDNNWWGNKVGAQLGFRWCPTDNLCIRSEINVVRPFTYSHGSSIQAWTHLNQAMAHPLGANFIEAAQTVIWRKGAWTFQEQFNVAAFGRDYDADGDGLTDNFGGNINRSYKDPFGGPFGHELLQGELHRTIFHSLTVSRSLKSLPYLDVFVTHLLRSEQVDGGSQSDHVVMLGIRTQGLLQPVQDY